MDRLRSLGFRVAVARLFEANTLYDNEAQQLSSSGQALRLRQAGDHSVLTFKGPAAQGTAHKVREEFETSLGSLEVAAKIFERLGYQPRFRYEKYRTEYQKAGQDGVVTFDETPIGEFLELEGSSSWIDATSKELGFGRQDYVLDSYGKLYLKECARRGVEPAHMVFSS